MFYPRSELYPQQRGAALITAMLVFALAAALMVGLQRDFSLTLQRGTHHFFSEQAWSYLMGAEGLAILALRADSQIDASAEIPSDHLGELWAQPSAPYPLDAGGWLTGQIQDLQGRINLNMLVHSREGVQERTGSVSGTMSGGEKARWNSTQKMLIRLLQTLGEDSLSIDEAVILTEAISDFIDMDSERRIHGAEDSDYRYSEFPYLPANRVLASVSELRAVRGMTEPVYRALAPLVTVWPSSYGRLNILTAPLPVIRSLNADNQLEPLPLMEAQLLMDLRNDGGIASVEDLLAHPLLEGLDIASLKPLLGVRSEWFLLDATVQLLDRERHLFTVLNRREETSVAVFRSEGEL